MSHRTTHGGSRSAEYRVWIDMRRRCSAPGDTSFANYGGRGIVVCERWQRFESFLADMGRRPSPQHTLERVDNDGAYEPKNCRWATRAEQQRNRRANRFVNLGGRLVCVTDAARELGVSRATLASRLRKWPVERALVSGTSRRPGAKLSPEQVAEIRALAPAGASQRTIAARFGVTKATIGNVLRRDTWADLPV